MIWIKNERSPTDILAGMNTPKARMLALAARTLGSPKQLAELLGVSTPVLADWMGGDAVAPDSAYFTALDIVSKGPYYPNK